MTVDYKREVAKENIREFKDKISESTNIKLISKFY